ncbi:MAG: glycosyltransferase [Candidatus Omnitrophota bacterium]
MNILQILPSLKAGGVETGTVDLAKVLMKKGHRAVVISNGGELVDELERSGARHYALDVDKKSILSVIAMVQRVSEIIRHEEIDIVHARSRVPGWIAFFAARITKKPFITTAHGYYKTHALSEVMAWGRYVIVASNVMAKHMMHNFNVPYDRIRLIPRGVDLEKFTFSDGAGRTDDAFVVGMVSRITPLKGHAAFMKAVSIAYRSIPKLKAVIVGEAPKGKEKYKQELDLLTRRLGITRIVEFLGPRKDTPKILKSLDLLASCTVTPEAFGRSIVEAQACGVPVVATKVGGVVDIIEDGYNGLLVDPDDPKGMAEAIVQLYKDKDLCDKLVKNARKRVEDRFALKRMSDATIEVYREAIRAKNILIIKFGSVGDCILSVPGIRAIRTVFRRANIKLLVGAGSRDVFSGCPYIDDKIICDFNKKDTGLRGVFRVARTLVKNNFDIVVDLQNNKKSHLLAFLSMAQERYGYRNKKLGFLLNRGIPDDRAAMDPLEHQFRVLKTLGVGTFDKKLELFPTGDDDDWARSFLESHWIKPGQALVGVHVRASPRWESKNWPIEYIAELCDRIAVSKSIRVVITGSRDDEAHAEELCSMTQAMPINAVGKTSLMQLASLVKYFKAYVTPDSAPLHVASSSRIPVIGLFGPTDPARHAVPSARMIIINKKIECAPCYRPRCKLDDDCMRMISVDEVFNAVSSFIGCEKAVEVTNE